MRRMVDIQYGARSGAEVDRNISGDSSLRDESFSGVIPPQNNSCQSLPADSDILTTGQSIVVCSL